MRRAFSIRTTGRTEIQLVTDQVKDAVREIGIAEGLCVVYTPHTTAAIAINEDADPDVLTDLTKALEKLVPDVRFKHGEGNSDAHFLSTLVGVSVTIPIENANLLLGRWQGIYFLEFDGPRTRTVSVHVVG